MGKRNTRPAITKKLIQPLPLAKPGGSLEPMKPEPKRPVGRPPFPAGEAADANIVLRVTRARKGAYVRAARGLGQTLSAWMFTVCDKAADEQARP